MSTATRNVLEILGERCDRCVELAGLECRLRRAHVRIGDEVELVGKRIWSQPAALSSLLRQEGVAQRTQEVAQVVLVMEEARSRKDPRIRLLDEVLGLLPRAAQRPGRPVEPIEMISELGTVELALRWALACRRRCVQAGVGLDTHGGLHRFVAATGRRCPVVEPSSWPGPNA